MHNLPYKPCVITNRGLGNAPESAVHCHHAHLDIAQDCYCLMVKCWLWCVVRQTLTQAAVTAGLAQARGRVHGRPDGGADVLAS